MMLDFVLGNKKNSSIFKELDNMINYVQTWPFPPTTTGWTHTTTDTGRSLSYGLFENDKEFVVSLDLPGIDKENISLDFNDDTLKLTANRVKEKTTALYDYRSYGKMECSVHIPSSVSKDKIIAKLYNGVLTVTLPKTKQVKSESINIKIE